MTDVDAQAVHSAEKGQVAISIGAEASLFQPDYIGTTNAQSNGLSLRYGLTGFGLYGDFRYSRWVQFEAEGRMLDFNKNEVVPNPLPAGIYYVNEVGEKTLMVGPRIPITHYKALTPYGKALFGIGRTSINSDIYSVHNSFYSFAMAYGGGVDWKLTKKVNVRLFDFEYQNWNMNVNNVTSNYTYHFPIHPYGASIGVSYNIY